MCLVRVLDEFILGHLDGSLVVYENEDRSSIAFGLGNCETFAEPNGFFCKLRKEPLYSASDDD